ncbi:hypothetical protein AN640_00525 [Candidatus Epulonipiscium fishelsonii]|uniref:Uncharacterized protein n=1 Tax=Candidatus Epulonipiscium fishelsonii TaxID=77094 RepID=A0ACC8X8J8_9FIRM|nr:hypothetical protein AN640_00525 [Epulopiscium sp. SCG-D08WGA-EpuloA1]
MKLKQKLAMVLAATMITTSIPMVTLAKTTALSQTLILKKNDTVGYKTDKLTKVTTGYPLTLKATTDKTTTGEALRAVSKKLYDGDEVFYRPSTSKSTSTSASISASTSTSTIKFDNYYVTTYGAALLDDDEFGQFVSTSNTIPLNDIEGYSFKYDQFLTLDLDIGIKDTEPVEVYLKGDKIEFYNDDDAVFKAWREDYIEKVGEALPEDYIEKEKVGEAPSASPIASIPSITLFNFKDKTTAADDAGTIKIERISGDKLKLTLKGDKDAKEGIDQFRLPLMYQVTDTGTPKLTVTGNGEIKESTLVLSKGEVGDKDFTAIISDEKIIPIDGDGNLGSIEIKEIKKGNINRKMFRVILDSSDVIFKNSNEKNDGEKYYEVNPSYGLTSILNEGKVKFVVSDNDESIGYLLFNYGTDVPTAPGGVEIEGLDVETEDASIGELKASIELISEDELDQYEVDFNEIFNKLWNDDTISNDEWETLDDSDADSDGLEDITGTIAEVKEHGLSISVDGDKLSLIGGKYDDKNSEDYEVTIEINDATKEYLQDEGRVELILEGGIFAPGKIPANSPIDEDADEDSYMAEITGEDDKIDPVEIEIDEDSPNVAEVDLTDLDETSDELKITFSVIGNPGFDGDIKVTAEGKKWDEPLTTVIGTVINPTRIQLIEGINVIENEKALSGGIITIAETDEKMFDTDDVIVVKLEDLDIDDADVVADNGMEVDSKISDGHLLIQVQRKSNNPATITIDNIDLDGTGYVPVGEYTAYIGGQGIHKANTFIDFEESKTSRIVGIPDVVDKDDVEDFKDDGYVDLEEYDEDKDEIFAAAFALDQFVVSTRPEPEPEPEPLPPVIIPPTPDPTPQPDDVRGANGNYGLPDTDITISKGTATVDGVKIKVSTSPRNVNGTTMVGVADLATLLGIPRDKEYGNTLTYHQEADGTGVATIRLEKRRIVEVKTGSNKVALSDFNSLTGTYKSIGELVSAQPAQIIDGKMFVPMRQIGESLGFEVSWNPSTATAIFSNVG